jgi:hypothetical protein
MIQTPDSIAPSMTFGCGLLEDERDDDLVRHAMLTSTPSIWPIISPDTQELKTPERA